MWDDLTSPQARDAIRLSIECSLWSTALCVVFGVPLAWVLARTRFPGRSLVRALVVLPMVLPPVVGGVALLFTFQRNGGLIGEWLYDWFGLQFTFSTAGAVLAETFVAMPFLVITVEAGLRTMDQRYEEAAASLGAGRWTVFRRVTIPMIAPALYAGPRWRGRARSASSAPRSPSPGTSRGAPRRCRSRCTCSSRPTRTSRSRSASCCSWCRSSCSSRCGTTGSEGCVTLEADVGLQLGTLDLDVQVSATEGETVAVLGPNGAGKSTLLRALAGLLRIDRGTVVIDGVTVDDPSEHVYVVPEKRSVGVVFQDYLLFPQMSVRENVAFGLRARGTPKPAAREAGRRMARARRSRRVRRREAPPAVGWSGAAGRARARRWRRSRACCCSTSRWPRSTSASAPSCGATCAPISRRSPARGSW